MNEIKKDLLKAVVMFRAMPMALDLWVMFAALLYAFDKHIPWFVWLMIVLEVFIVLKLGTEVKEKQNHV